VALCVAIIVAIPMSIIPLKEVIEDTYFKGTLKRTMNKQDNFNTTVVVILASLGMALVIPNIGDAITICGVTTNPFIGFFIPIALYWKAIPHKPWYSWEKVKMIFVAALIAVASILAIIQFVQSKL